MEDNRYWLVFEGDIREGWDLYNVKKKLATLFGTTVENVEQLFCGNPKIIKQNLDIETAQGLKKEFERTGAICRIERITPGPILSRRLSQHDPQHKHGKHKV